LHRLEAVAEATAADMRFDPHDPIAYSRRFESLIFDTPRAPICR